MTDRAALEAEAKEIQIALRGRMSSIVRSGKETRLDFLLLKIKQLDASAA